jgi:hypothetical protein
VTASAEGTLSNEIVKFLRFCKENGEQKLGRNPYSADLLQYFQNYAETVIEAEVQERLSEEMTAPKCIRTLKLVISNVVYEISRRRGTWWRIVFPACQLVNLGFWTTRYGTYTSSDLLHPPAMQLRAGLQLWAKRFEPDWWSKMATQEVESQVGAPCASSKPSRAEWIRAQLKECGWSSSDPIGFGGPDRKTVERIMRGERVHNNSLKKIAVALSAGRKTPMSVSDIPDA